MSEEKFTPPPWSVPDKGELRGAVVAKDGKMVCDPSGAGRHEDEAEANARLIAAAPEMYELLGCIQDYLQTLVFDDIDQQFINEIWIDEIRMEMKKARGEE